MDDRRGFTLLEVLVSLAILSITLLLAYQVLSGAIAAEDRSERWTGRGFTLVELAVVLFVLGLVLWVALPRLAHLGERDRDTVFRALSAGSEAAYVFPSSRSGRPGSSCARTTGRTSSFIRTARPRRGVPWSSGPAWR